MFLLPFQLECSFGFWFCQSSVGRGAFRHLFSLGNNSGEKVAGIENEEIAMFSINVSDFLEEEGAGEVFKHTGVSYKGIGNTTPMLCHVIDYIVHMEPFYRRGFHSRNPCGTKNRVKSNPFKQRLSFTEQSAMQKKARRK